MCLASSVKLFKSNVQEEYTKNCFVYLSWWYWPSVNIGDIYIWCTCCITCKRPSAAAPPTVSRGRHKANNRTLPAPNTWKRQEQDGAFGELNTYYTKTYIWNLNGNRKNRHDYFHSKGILTIWIHYYSGTGPWLCQNLV